MHRRNYQAWSFSPLKQINAHNVGSLQLRWVWGMDEDGRQQFNPLVHDGVMFLSNNLTNVVQAVDAKTGELIWENRIGPTLENLENATRTMALYGNLLFYPATQHNALCAGCADRQDRLAERGVSPTRTTRSAGMTVIHGKVLIGLTRCDDLSVKDHCWIAAYDANTGKQVLEDADYRRSGHLGRRHLGQVDKRPAGQAPMPGSPAPTIPNSTRPIGAQDRPSRHAGMRVAPTVMSCSQIRPWRWMPIPESSNGISRMRPGESLDLDEVYERVLVDHGSQKTVLEVGKSGILWKLDRETGKFLGAQETVFQNVWAKIDMKTGRTTYRDDILHQTPKVALASCPSPEGGHDWPANQL